MGTRHVADASGVLTRPQIVAGEPKALRLLMAEDNKDIYGGYLPGITNHPPEALR